MSTKIVERTGTRIALPEAKGDKYKVRLMGWEPGSKVVEGSSADYPVAAIKRDFPEAFPAGTRMRANHDGFCESGGDVRRIMAKTVDSPWAEADGMYAHMLVPDEYKQFVASFGDVIGLSISAAAEVEYEAATDDDGDPILDHDNKPVMVPRLSERGAQIVSRFLTAEEYPYNSVDFVEAPGADGRIVSRALESAKSLVEHFTIREAATFAKGTRKSVDEDSDGTPPRKVKKESTMDPEERAALASEITESVTASVLEAVRPPAPTEAAPTLSATVEAVVAAGLTEAGRSEVYARIDRGETLESAIAAETTREAAIEAEVTRRVEAAKANASEGVFGFGFTSDDTTGGKLGTESLDTTGAKVDEAFDAMFEEETA